MRLRHIEVFHTIMVEGSISAAARALNISQPAVSNALKHAEDQLGFELFHRQGKRIVPSHEAKLLFAHTQDLMQQVSRVAQICENMNEGIGHALRIGVVPALSFQLLPLALSSLRKTFPHIAITANVMRYDAMREALVRQDIDIALSFYGGDIQGMHTQKIGTGRFVVVSNRATRDFEQQLDINLVTRDDFISIADSGPLGQMLDIAKEDAGLKANPLLATETYHTAISMVRVGLGVAIVDVFSARANQGSDLDMFEIQNLPKFDVSVSWSPATDKTLMLQAFAKTLADTTSALI